MSKCNSLNANHHYSFHSFENISHFRRQKNLVLGQWCQPRLEQPSFLFKYLLEFPKILRRKPSLFGAFARWMGQNKMRLQELLHLWGTKSCRHANSIGPCRLAVTALIVYQSGKWYFQRGKFRIHRLHIWQLQSGPKEIGSFGGSTYSLTSRAKPWAASRGECQANGGNKVRVPN